MELFLVRHGQSVGNTEPDLDMPDSPLTAKGKEQAGLVARYLLNKGITAIYSSPLIRAMQSAQPLANLLGYPIHVMKALYEVREGSPYEGPSRQALTELVPEALFDDSIEEEGWICPGGDLPETSKLRAQAALHQLQLSGEERIAVFCHGMFNEYVIREALGIGSERIRFIQENTGVNHFIIHKQAIEVLKINDTVHLQLKKDVRRDSSANEIAYG
ncbi:histidine phosphatase family protein [Cohnella sp.]|uniref:histidine phosphatase family protein n=1 Tax=Cohnella sp. TaxID=1883426 RepID=UPI003561BF76